MTSYEAPYGSDYLLVRLDVDEAATSKFEELMREVLKIFLERLQWKLVRALKQDDPKDGTRTYLHLWQANNPINLWEAMYSVGGNSHYAKLHPLIKREQQDIMRLAVTYSPVALLDDPKKRVLIQTLDLTQDWFIVQNWCWKLPESISSGRASPRGWEFAFALQAQSGQLRRHFHLWQSDDAALAAPAEFAPDPQAGVDRAPDRNQQAAQAVLKRGPVEVYTAVSYTALNS